MADKIVTLDGVKQIYFDVRDRLRDESARISTKVDEAYVEDEYLVLRAEGEEVARLTGFGGGGGGGGGGSSSTLTVTSEEEWLSKTIAKGSKLSITFSWSSYQEEQETGPGTMTIKVNNVTKKTQDVNQGTITVEVSDLLNSGSNTIRIAITDLTSNTKAINFRVTVATYSLTSTFNSTTPFTGNIDFTYTANGVGDKTMHFLLDDIEIGTKVISTSNRSDTFVIPAQSHGSHKFEAYFTALVDGSELTSEKLYYDIICLEEGNDTPIITSSFNETELKQYNTYTVPYQVYSPASLTSSVDLYINSEYVTLPAVPRTVQNWVVRADKAGALVLKIVSGTAQKVFNLNVKPVEIDIHAETDKQELYLTSYGRSNNEPEEQRKTWEFENEETHEVISAQLEGFNWVSNGWMVSEGNTVLRVGGGAAVTIPYKPFDVTHGDIKRTGKTLEFEFATKVVDDYDAVVIDCSNEVDKAKLRITAQKATFSSKSVTLETQYKEEEHIRLGFVVTSNTEDRLIYIYINGIISGMLQYSEEDSFSQSMPMNITIGSPEATIDIYNIRIYGKALTRYQMVNNWIADIQDGEEMLKQYNRNNIYDSSGKAVITQLPNDLPYMVFDLDTIDHLPDYKGDKQKTLGGYFVDPLNEARNFTFIGAQIDVQGTSSQGYPIKNWKVKFNGGFSPTSKDKSYFDKYNEELATYKGYRITADAIATGTFTFKADYASSEGANNVELVRYYNDLCTYKTPPQKENPAIRQGIDGFPMVIFSETNGELSFMGKYNFNNDKGTDEVYGFENNGMKFDKSDYHITHDGVPDECWEMTSNPSELGRWKRGVDETKPREDQIKEIFNNFEVRFPAEWQDAHDDSKPEIVRYERFNNLIKWVASTDPEQATNLPLPEPVTYETKVYTTDSAEYRVAKFKAGIKDHFDLDDLIFYYIYTEMFLMIDSRVKNSFPTIFTLPNKTEVKDEHGEVIDVIYTESGKGRWVIFPYDMDTAIGINNEGLLVFGYNLEDTDHVSTEEGAAEVFNGQDSVLWNNLRRAFLPEIRTAYETLRAKTFSYKEIENRFENHQNKWPAAIFNEDAYFKYISPLINGYKGKKENNLAMCLGSKEQQRKWWLYNRFRYLDSKYKTGDAQSNFIKFRAYNVDDGEITIVPYADIYVRLKVGEGFDNTVRGARKQATKITCTLPQASDLESYVFSADQLIEVQGLSKFAPGSLDVSMAPRLQNLNLDGFHRIKHIDEITGEITYEDVAKNLNLKELNFIGDNNTSLKLRTLSVKDCPNLVSNINMSNCPNIEEVDFRGSSISGISLPDGGVARSIKLPNTITSLSLINQDKMETLEIVNDSGVEDVSNITILRVENTNPVLEPKIETILKEVRNGSAIRFIGFNFTKSTREQIFEFVENLNRLRGIDEQKYEVDTAQVKGTIKFDDATKSLPYEFTSVYGKDGTKYRDLTFDCLVEKTVTFYNDDSIFATKKTTSEFIDVSDLKPTRPKTEEYAYKFDKWVDENDQPIDFNKINKSIKAYATYIAVPIFDVTFMSYDGTTILYVAEDIPQGDDAVYGGEIPVAPEPYVAPYIGWGYDRASVNESCIKNVTENRTVYAVMDWKVTSMEIAVGTANIHYFSGEIFNGTGLDVTVNKEYLGEVKITDFDYSKEPLTMATTSIDIVVKSRTEGGWEFRKPLNIYMADFFTIKTMPSRLLYESNEDISIEGTVLEATFTDSQTLTYTEGIDFEPKKAPVVEEFFVPQDITLKFRGKTAVYQINVMAKVYTGDEFYKNSWELIKKVTDAGLATNYFNIGNKKPVKLDVPVEFILPGTYNFRIVGFNEESKLNPGVNTITFGLATGYVGGEEGSEKEILFSSIDPGIKNCLKSWYKGCSLVDVCNKLYDELPYDLRDVIIEVNKGQADQEWTDDNFLGTQYTNICKTQKNKLFVPSKYELFGGDSIEKDICTHYSYYKNGGDKIKYSNRLYIPTSWWTRSLDYRTRWESTQGSYVLFYYYHTVKEDGSAYESYAANTSYGFVPFFVI